LNVSAIDVFPDATLLVQPNIISSEFSINDKKMVESYFTKMSGQWKYDQRFVSIKWFGNVENRDKKSTIKIDPVKFTSKGICSWLGPLTKEDDNYLFTRPPGALGAGNSENLQPDGYVRRSARGRRGRRRFVRLLSHVQVEHHENHQEAASGDPQSLRQPLHPGSWLHVHQIRGGSERHLELVQRLHV